MSLSSFFSTIISGGGVSLPTPSLVGTYGRWSTAESINGGLNGTGDWVSVGGMKTFSRNGDAFLYSTNGLNTKPCLLTPIGNGSFFIDNLPLLNDSAATIVLMQSDLTSIQVVYEYSANVNNEDKSFANYIESSVSEGYMNYGGTTLRSEPQVFTPFLLATAVRAANNSIAYNQNNYPDYSNFNTYIPVPGANFGTQKFNLFSRNSTDYFTKGKLAVFHLFSEAPSTTVFNQWIDYYKNLYNIT